MGVEAEPRRFLETTILEEEDRKTFRKLDGLVEKLMANEGRKDAPFRLALLISQLGAVAKYITHDQKENPGARPYGSKKELVNELGQAYAMLLSICASMEVPSGDAAAVGLANWVEADWRKVEAKGTDKELKGRIACPGKVRGTAFVVSEERPISSHERGGILVIEHVDGDDANHIVSHRPLAVITDQGGTCSHAGSIAREHNITTVVATGNATKIIKHGDQIIIDAPYDKEDAIITFANP